jgi:hypothetical protein
MRGEAVERTLEESREGRSGDRRQRLEQGLDRAVLLARPVDS